MKTAIFAVTARGALLAQHIKNIVLKDADIYIKNGRQGNMMAVHAFDSLTQIVKDTIGVYQQMIFIMATGIVVRTIAPFIVHKAVDPAIVVVDERGLNAISLLSGHIGGANELTRHIAQAISCNAVITTATDVNNLLAPDVFAVKANLKIESFEDLRSINAAIVNGDNTAYFIDDAFLGKGNIKLIADEMGIQLIPLSDYKKTKCTNAVIITDKIIAVDKLHLLLRPPTLVAGIGCRRGTSADDILTALNTACQSISYSILSIKSVCSADIKHDEAGIHTVAGKINASTQFFNRLTLNEIVTKYKLPKSAFVEKEIGVGNVCQAAAILGSAYGKVLLPKTKYKNVTVAIAQDASWL